MHMRTTLNIADDLLRKASELAGVKEKTVRKMERSACIRS
jgi:hypothetical protein